MEEKRWFVTVDYCNQGKRGIFCNRQGVSYSKETQHTEDEMWNILDAFSLILSPQSIQLSKEELAQYTQWTALAEYSYEFGIARMKEKEPC